MAIKIPKRGLGGFCQELIASCSTSQKERIERGAVFRALYLTGSDRGEPQTYPKSTSFVQNLSSYAYSPVELRFSIQTSEQPDEKAMARAAEQQLHSEIRNGNVDMAIDETTLWSMVKGKAFTKILWSSGGFEPYVIQPELMGVLREDYPDLDSQEAFFQSTYMTRGQFMKLVESHPDREELVRKVSRGPSKTDEGPGRDAQMKQVIVGAMNPFRAAGQSTPAVGNNITDWLGGPRPVFDPDIMAQLIRLDELWIRDADRDDWTTIQLVDEAVIEGKYIHRNIFADPSDIKDQAMLDKSKKNNPLSGHHPFVEFCGNPLQGYFWGVSELNSVALLQLALNKRIDGIQSLLRRQEDPPRVFVGSNSVNQNAYAKLNKPGGFLTESSPNTKIETLAPSLPQDLWADLKQIEAMYDDMGGFTPTLQGRGEGGVRAQAHAETLVRTSSPRFKNRALRIERSVEAAGGLMLDILKARYTKKLAGWEKPGEGTGSEAPESWWRRMFVAPAPGMKRIEFLMRDLPDNCKVTVDSHSSSPAFSHEGKELAFALAKAGAIGPVDLIALTHPAHEENLAMAAEARQIEQAAFAAAHPELAAKESSKKKK